MACPPKYVSLIKLGLYLLLNPHALHTFNQIGADSTIEDAKAALGWIQKESVAVFKRSDCHRALHGRFPKVNRLVEALDVLRGWNAVEGPEKVKSPSIAPAKYTESTLPLLDLLNGLINSTNSSQELLFSRTSRGVIANMR